MKKVKARDEKSESLVSKVCFLQMQHFMRLRAGDCVGRAHIRAHAHRAVGGAAQLEASPVDPTHSFERRLVSIQTLEFPTK
jgi:hypothetical protein